MKTFKFFKTRLVLIGVLIMSVSQMWAADVCQKTIIYFDNSASNWNSNYTYFGINDTHCWYMNKVTNTKLYVHKRTDGTWGGYSNVRLMADAGDWNQGERLGGYSNLSANMDHYTDGYSNYGFGADYYYCIKPANGNNLASLSISGLGSASNGSVAPLNKTITVKAKVSTNNGNSYSETASPANLTASSNKFTAYNSCSSAQSLSNGTITCGYTATTTLTAPSTDPTGYKFVGWYDSDGNEKTTSKTLTIYPTANATYYAYYRRVYSIDNGATVVWDFGARSNWSNVYIRRTAENNSNTHEELTRPGSSGYQWAKTYTSAVSDIRYYMFRDANGGTWNDYGQTTNMYNDISGITIYTYCNSTTSEDNKNKLDWQITKDCHKGSSGGTIYFDDTNTGWGSGHIYFNYGVDFDGNSSGFHRKIDFATSKVPGTANLWKLKASETEGTNQGKTDASGQLAHDIYFQKWYVSKSYGYTNYNPITDTHVLERTAIYTDDITTDGFTLIPTSASSGAGTDGNPKLWTTTKITGHTRRVTIGSHDNGTITVSYTDESNTAQAKTATTDVAHTCIITVTVTPDDGYDYESGSLQVAGAAFTPGNTYTVSSDISTTASFIPHHYNIAFDANDANYTGTATGSTAGINNVAYDANVSLTENGFHRIGYAFNGWTENADGSGDSYEDEESVSKLTATDGETVTLYAKWVSDTKTFAGGGANKSWITAGNWSGSAVPSDDWSSVTINAEVELSSAVHIGQLSFGESGKLVIQPTGALEVAGTITNTEASKIEINSSESNQGALIFNSTGSTAATVTMTMNASDGKFNFIAIPVSYVDVSEAFAGSGVFTYVWDNSENKWDKRGYYDGISAYEAIIAKGIGSTTFSGNLLSNNTDFSSGSLSYSSDGDGDVYMFGNSWTAPIKHSAMTLIGIESMNILNGRTNGWDGVTGDDVIPALQAYVVEVGSSGGSITIDYENAVRSVKGSRNTALKAPQRYADEKPEPITIYVSGNDMRTRIRLFEDATRFSDELDEGWEAYYMEGEGYAGDFYAIGTRKMNVLATSDLEGTVVGFVPGQATSYTISFAGDGKGYYLNDTELELSTLIAEGNTYEFTPNENTNATRFVISKTPIRNTPTGLEEVSEGTKARKQLIDGVLYIIRDGRIYNTTGALYK